MPIPRSPTAQVTWIPRQAEGDFAALLAAKQARVIPLIGAGGAGKTSLLHRFMTHCTATKVPALSLDLTKLQTNSALEALMQATTQRTDAFDACRKRLQESYEAMSAILQSYGTHAGQAADLLQKTAGEESFGMIVDALVGSAKAAHHFWQRKESQQHRKLLRTPEESLLHALAEDFAKGGALLIDTMEQAARETLQTRLHSRDDGDLVTVHGDQSTPVAFTEYLARLAFFLFDKPVLMVIAGRPPALRELGGLPHAYFAPTMEVPPFTEPEIEEYVRRQLPQLPPAKPEDIHRLHGITLGNPFLLERVTRLMAEWQPAWCWEAAQWEPLIDSYRKDDRHGLLLFVTQRLLTHVLQDDTAFWRLALPRHSVHRDMADLLFPENEFPEASGEERLKIYESKGLIYRGQDPAHFFLHDETRAALQAWAEHRKVWLDERAAALHGALGAWFAQAAGWPAAYPEPHARIETNANPLLLEAAYHQVMANADLESLHRQDRRQFWEQLSGSIWMTNAAKLRATNRLPTQPTSEVDSLLQSLAAESSALAMFFSKNTITWLRAQSQLGTLPIDWLSNTTFLRSANLSSPQDDGLLVLIADNKRNIAPDEAEALFKRAIDINPNNSNNISFYAKFLSEIRHRHDDAEVFYQRAIEMDPKNANILGSYANFLNEIRQQHDRAEALYKQAIEAEPTDADNLGNYATFLRSIRQQHDEAEALYKLALEINPRNANNLGNYANFLNNIRRRPEDAEALYKRAIEIDPRHTIHLCNYANFLSNIRQRHDDAETLYKRAIEIDPANANHHANYGIFLNKIRSLNDRAEALYQCAIKIDPSHANALGNYAALLSTNPQRHDEAEVLYRRAIESDSRHANNLGNYANFLSSIPRRNDEAIALYRRAIEANPGHAGNLGNYALLLSKKPECQDEAEALYRRAIEADPEHANNLANYALFLSTNPQRWDEAEALYRRAIEANPHHGNSLVGYAYFLSAGRQCHDEAEPYFRRSIEVENPTAFSLFLCAEFLSDIQRRDDEAEPLYLRAMEQDPSDAAIAGSAAIFLHVRRKDHSRAEAAYRQTLALAPQEPNCLGNLAQLVLARGEREERRALIDRVFAAEPPPPLQLELWFYRYAHFPDTYPEAEAAIEALLAEGVRSPGWDLSITLAQAAREGHPDTARLEALAVRLASDPPPAAGEAAGDG